MEALRFNYHFDYKISLPKDLDIEVLKVPPLILQPYVENAIWHGLMHKDGDRSLSVTFRKVDEDIFQCVIDDNGIGRQKSFELKAQQSKAKRHESKGLKISKDRIEVLKRQGYHAALDIIDKSDSAGNATGTKVIIELSTFLQN